MIFWEGFGERLGSSSLGGLLTVCLVMSRALGDCVVLREAKLALWDGDF